MTGCCGGGTGNAATSGKRAVGVALPVLQRLRGASQTDVFGIGQSTADNDPVDADPSTMERVSGEMLGGRALRSGPENGRYQGELWGQPI